MPLTIAAFHTVSLNSSTCLEVNAVGDVLEFNGCFEELINAHTPLEVGKRHKHCDGRGKEAV